MCACARKLWRAAGRARRGGSHAEAGTGSGDGGSKAAARVPIQAARLLTEAARFTLCQGHGPVATRQRSSRCAACRARGDRSSHQRLGGPVADFGRVWWPAAGARRCCPGFPSRRQALDDGFRRQPSPPEKGAVRVQRGGSAAAAGSEAGSAVSFCRSPANSVALPRAAEAVALESHAARLRTAGPIVCEGVRTHRGSRDPALMALSRFRGHAGANAGNGRQMGAVTGGKTQARTANPRAGSGSSARGPGLEFPSQTVLCLRSDGARCQGFGGSGCWQLVPEPLTGSRGRGCRR